MPGPYVSHEWYSREQVDAICVSAGIGSEWRELVYERLNEVATTFASDVTPHQTPEVKERRSKKVGRPANARLNRFVGDLFGLWTGLDQHDFGTSVGGQDKKGQGKAGGPLVRFLFGCCSTLAERLESEDDLLVTLAETAELPVGSSTHVAELRALTPEALRRRLQRMVLEPLDTAERIFGRRQARRHRRSSSTISDPS